MDPFLDEEEQIAKERERDEWFQDHALWQPMSELPDLQRAVSISPSATVRDAIQAMIDQRCGCVLVVENEKLIGVFSERDVLRKVAGTDLNIETTPVSELMTRNPKTLKLQTELVYAMQQMTVGGYRHIPLLDDDGRPVFVVSMRDIVGYIVSIYSDHVLRLAEAPEQHFGATREGA